MEDGGPLLLIGGGSGLVPLMSMSATVPRAAADRPRLLVSARRIKDLLYRAELEALAGGPGLAVRRTLTRERPDGWDGWTGAWTARCSRRSARRPPSARAYFVCGPTGFVEQVADALVDLGHAPDAIHAERFGPTGG